MLIPGEVLTLPDFLFLFMKKIKTLIIILSALVIVGIWLGSLAFADYYRTQGYKKAVEQGDEVLKPFIEGISYTSFNTVDSLLDLNDKQSIRMIKDSVIRETDKDTVEDIESSLILCPHTISADFYNIKNRMLTRGFLNDEGKLEFAEIKESGYIRDIFIRGSIIEGDEIYMSKVYETTDPRTKENVKVISYVNPLHSDSGELVALTAFTVPVSKFFADFNKYEIPEGLFVVDNEGNYLWHTDKTKVLEKIRREDSSFFADFLKSYPDILSGRGESRVYDEDSKKYIEVRPVYPAFEVVFGGVIRKINAQETPNENRVWFIGYEE